MPAGAVARCNSQARELPDTSGARERACRAIAVTALIETMSTAPVSRLSWGRLIAPVVAGLLFMYAASLAPVAVYCDRRLEQNDTTVGPAFRRFYYPLLRLLEGCPPVGRFYAWYYIECKRIADGHERNGP